MSKRFSNWQFRIDQAVAILAGSLPVALVLGVVVFEFFICLTGLIWLGSKIKFPNVNRGGITGNSVFWPIMCWLAVIIASRSFNGGGEYRFAQDLAFIRYPLFMLAILDLSTRIPVHRYLIAGLLTGIIYAGINMLSAHLFGYDFLGKPLSRYIGKLKEGQKIAAFCAYAAPFLLLWSIFDRQLAKQKRIWLLIIGCLAVVLMLTCRIRTACLAAIIGLFGGFVGQWVARKHLKIKTVLFLSLLACFGVGVVIWLQPSLESMYDRLYDWKVSYQIWNQNPVVGVGISSFNDAFLEVAESGIVTPVVSPTGNIYQNPNPRHAHNVFLQLMACNGILGLGIFIWLLWTLVNIIRKSIDSWYAGLWSWPFVCLAIGLTGWNIYDPFYTTILFFFMALIGVSANSRPGAIPA